MGRWDFVPNAPSVLALPKSRRVVTVHAAREGVQQAIEDIVTAFTEAKLAQSDDSTTHDSPGDLATPVVPVVIDAELPRRLAG
jgi:hypothetical protein